MLLKSNQANKKTILKLISCARTDPRTPPRLQFPPLLLRSRRAGAILLRRPPCLQPRAWPYTRPSLPLLQALRAGPRLLYRVLLLPRRCCPPKGILTKQASQWIIQWLTKLQRWSLPSAGIGIMPGFPIQRSHSQGT